MVPPRLTRRDVLCLSSAALAGLAGCAARPSGRLDSPSPTASEPDYSHSVDTPESSTVRNPSGEPAVRSSARSPEENAFESSASWAYENWLVTSPGERDALDLSRATTDLEAATDFVATTDLSETTLLVHQYDVGECETRRLDRLEWGSDFSCGGTDCVGISLTYERAERDGDCRGVDSDEGGGPPYSGDSHASETTFVRVPAQIRSYGRFRVQV